MNSNMNNLYKKKYLTHISDPNKKESMDAKKSYFSTSKCQITPFSPVKIEKNCLRNLIRPKTKNVIRYNQRGSVNHSARKCIDVNLSKNRDNAMREHSLSHSYNNPIALISYRPRISSVMSARSSRPIFQKLSQIICQDDPDQDLMFDSDPETKKTGNVTFEQPFNRSKLLELKKQSSSVMTTTAGSNSTKKWTGAMKKAKCDTLGFFIDRASTLVKMSPHHTKSTALIKSFKESPDNYFSQENKNIQKKSFNCASVERKQMTQLSDRKRVSTSKKNTLKSFDDSPFSNAPNFFEKKGRNSMQPKKSPFGAKNFNTDSQNRISEPKNDASDLLEFIELEDYCRRSTTAITKVDTSEEISMSSSKRDIPFSTNWSTKKVPAEPCVKKSTFQKHKKSRKANESTHLVRTMAITITADKKIIY